MSLFSKVGEIAKDLGKAAKGLEHMAGSAMKLDFKGMAKGASEVQGASLDAVKQGALMTPAGMAANTLTGGGLENLMSKAQAFSSKVGGKFMEGLAGGAASIKDGGAQMLHGAATGNLGEVAGGAFSAGTGAASLASYATPTGLAGNAVMATVDAAGSKDAGAA